MVAGQSREPHFVFQQEEYEMEIEAASGHSVAGIIAGLNAGKNEIAVGNATITDAVTKEFVAHVGCTEATAAGVGRLESEQTHA